MRLKNPVISLLTFFSLTSGASTLSFPLSQSPQTLDPTRAEDFNSIKVLFNLGSGLVQLDKDLKPRAGWAEKWKVSADGKTYTFEIRTKAKWSDGEEITAAQFLAGLKNTFSPEVVSKIAYPLVEVVEGAKKFKNKEILDFNLVGIKVLDSKKLQIQLVRPCSYFLNLLAMPYAFPLRKTGAIKERDATSGPFFIQKMMPESEVSLIPNRYFYELPPHSVDLKIVPDNSTQVRLFQQNQLDIVENLSAENYPKFKKSSIVLEKPFTATYYLGFRLDTPPFDNLQVRKALSLAIDRSDLARVLVPPQNFSTKWIPQPFPGSLDLAKNSFRPEEARKLWGQINSPPKSLELYYDDQEKNRILVQRIQHQFKQTLGLELRLNKMEWKAYLHHLSYKKPGFYRFGWLTSFPDPASHLQVFKSDNPNNNSAFKDLIYDQLVDQISEMQDSRERLDLIERAQNRLLDEMAVIIPLFHYSQNHLVSSRLKDIEITPMGILHLHRAFLKP